MMRQILLTLSLCILCSQSALAQSKIVQRSTDVLCFAPAATGLVAAIAKKDKKGVLQLGLGTATGIAMNYGLNACIKKNRPLMPANPSWGDRHAFPSTHTMAAFDGATFLMRRYGWKWGVPAYVVSTYVAWGRVHSKKHDWWDVAGGAAIGAGCALIYTRPFTQKMDLSISPASFGEDGQGITAQICF